MPLHLTDAQQSLVLNVTRPLDRLQRAAFMVGLRNHIGDRSEVGDGELFRALRELQRAYYRYPRGTSLHTPKHTAKLAHRNDVSDDEL